MLVASVRVRNGKTAGRAVSAIAYTAAAAASGDQAAYPAVVSGLLWPIVSWTSRRSLLTRYMLVPK